MNQKTLIKFIKFGLVLLFLSVLGCEESPKIKSEILQIPVNLTVDRFDLAVGSSSESDISKLKKQYPQFFPTQYPDSVWVKQLKDTLQQELLAEVKIVFPDLEKEEEELKLLFKHMKYYFEGFKVPDVFTVVSNVDHENKVILTDDTLLLSLDTYLGSTHRFYGGFQQYIKKNFNKEQLVVDVASRLVERVVVKPTNRSFVSKMVYQGKLLYIKELLLPLKTKEVCMGYTELEYIWVEENESMMWRYFVERNLLYDTDTKLVTRFIANAPFSKFYLELDGDSPGMIGRYTGYKIVESFMNNNDISVLNLIQMDEEALFNKSKYKPAK